MSRYFCFDGQYFHLFDTEAEAKSEAETAIEWYTDGEIDEAVDQVCWGEVRQEAHETVLDTLEKAQERGDQDAIEFFEGAEYDYTASWALKDVPGSLLEALRIEAAALVFSLQWQKDALVTPFRCQICGGFSPEDGGDGHEEDCRIGAFLKKWDPDPLAREAAANAEK